jgi:thioredoxin reductase (NADPH)
MAQDTRTQAEGGPIETDVVIIGAGPAGLFQVFELGLLGIHAHVIDSLRHVGGQCTELYPDKPIYDIPAIPVCSAQELVERLMQQIKPFNAQFHLGHEVVELRRDGDGRFLLRTSRDLRFTTRAIVIAGGLGSFQPRPLRAKGAQAFEGKTIHYRVKDPQAYRGKRVAILGGGDSALDWTLELVKIAARLILIHRRTEFRAAHASVAKMQELCAQDRMEYVAAMIRSVNASDGRMTGLSVRTLDGEDRVIECDEILVFYGLAPTLGPIAEWGLNRDRNQIAVDTEKFQTSEPGIFAIGDINTYPGKKKLILSGFHEAALAAFAIDHYLHPDKKQFLQYTTTSPILHERLGVKDVTRDS